MNDSGIQVLKLTRTHLKALRFIVSHIEKHGLSPTYDQIAAAIPTVKSNARRIVGVLIANGTLSRAKHRFHNIIVTEKGLAATKDGRRRRYLK